MAMKFITVASSKLRMSQEMPENGRISGLCCHRSSNEHGACCLSENRSEKRKVIGQTTVQLTHWLRGEAPEQTHISPFKQVMKPAISGRVFDFATSNWI
jgi:hypothetical protein